MATKRKRVSKKTKKSWRKFVDISDVDNFLEDQRLEERLGVKYADQKDEELFEFDTKGENANTSDNQCNPGVNACKIVSFSSSMRLKETALPKCFEILEKRSAVPIPIRTKSKDSRKNIADKKFQRKLAVKQQEILKEVSSTSKLNKNKGNTDACYDIWSKENNSELGNVEWLTNDTVRHNLKNTGKLQKRVPKTTHSRTSLLPAVEFPHPGLSYNPSLKDHTDVLRQVAEKEIQLIKEEEHLNRVTNKMFSKITEEEMQKEWVSEMTVGLTMEKSEDDEDDDPEYKPVNPPVKNKKKTLKKRRKIKEQLALKEKLKNQKIEKRKLSDIYKLRKFNESISKKEERILRKMEKRKEKKSEKPWSTRLLSQIKYEDPDIDFQLPDELSGNLVSIKPEGNLLFDRYKSLQKRNILQPALKRLRKKAKRKEYERDHTKMGWENKVLSKNKKMLKKN